MVASPAAAAGVTDVLWCLGLGLLLALARDALGMVWRAHPGQGLYAITADADFEKHFGTPAVKRRKIYNRCV